MEERSIGAADRYPEMVYRIEAQHAERCSAESRTCIVGIRGSAGREGYRSGGPDAFGE